MTNCKCCGKSISDTDIVYLYPIYDINIKDKSITNIVAHTFCWDCFLSFTGAINAAINAKRNSKLCETCNLNTENKNEQTH